MKNKPRYGYPAVPHNARRMLLVRYDSFPFMLVHQAHRLPDGSYRWVSSWDAGHQNLGVAQRGSEWILAVLPIAEGVELDAALRELNTKYLHARGDLSAKFIKLRDECLAKHGVTLPKKGG